MAVAVGSLGLALALTTTTFGLLDAVRHPYLPVKDPDRVFTVGLYRDWNRAGWFEMYSALRDGARFYKDIALVSGRRVTAQVSDTLELQFVTQVSPNFFSLLGLQPGIGRVFAPGAPASAFENAAVVSYDLWATYMGARTLEGLTLRIDAQDFAVIGVLPPGVAYPSWADVWLALSPQAVATGARVGNAYPVVRFKERVSREEAEHELAVLAARLTATYGAGDREFNYTLRVVAGGNRHFERIHFAMAGAAAAVLLIACANLASLMLARGVVKRRELALRLALGAGRRTLVQQMLAESILIALAGAVIGVMLSVWALDVAAYRMPPSVREVGLAVPYLSWRVFVFGLAATGVTLVLFGLLPAIRASDVSVAEPLKDNTGTTTGKVRFRYNPLVIAQVAVSLVLLMGAALLTKAAARVAEYPFGYETRGLLRAWLRLPRGWISLDSASSLDSAGRMIHDLLAHVRSRDSVLAAAAWSWILPEEYTVISEDFDGERGFITTDHAAAVSPDFLRALGIPVIRGRDFLPGDEATSAVILEEDAIPWLWRGGDPVGRMVKLGDADTDAPWLRVIGIARRASLGFKWDPDLPDRFGLYVVSRRYPPLGQLAIRVQGSEWGGALRLQKEIRAVLPPSQGAARAWVHRWAEDWEMRVGARVFLVRVFSGFSVFALGLAAIGLYGVLAYGVSQRLREFAIRMALGAESGRVLRLVLHDGAVMVLAGTALGAFLAMFSAPILGDWLYDVFFTDAPSLVIAEVVLLVAGLAACLVPALRATRADPVEILRAT